MDIDHNTQDTIVHQERNKKWKSYSWEFVMLFLAVFCSFLAELYLNYKVEKDLELEYMKSLVDDLGKDTAEITAQINYIKNGLVPALDSSTTLLYLDDLSDSDVRKMYEVVPLSIRYFNVTFEDRTESQLKYSGNLRLIRNKNVMDSILEYWKNIDVFKDPVMTGYTETRSISKELIFSILSSNYFEGKVMVGSLTKNKKPKLISSDKVLRIKLGNHLSNLQSQAEGPIQRNLHIIQAKASQLIQMIKKAYAV